MTITDLPEKHAQDHRPLPSRSNKLATINKPDPSTRPSNGAGLRGLQYSAHARGLSIKLLRWLAIDRQLWNKVFIRNMW